MKTRILTTQRQVEKEVKAIVREETNKRVQQIQDETVKNTIYQSLGAMLYVLATKKGASSKYLNWLKDETETIFVQMATKAGGLDYTNDDILRYLKENYNVDFDESAFGEAWDDLREKNRR